MAELTYNIYTGVLVARCATGTLVVHAESGGSNLWTDSHTRQVGAHGSPGHVHGGPIPPGRWRVHSPGSPHPDGGRRRPNWIPIGPVVGRTYLYIHCGWNTEGCINVPISQRTIYNRLLEAVRHDGGGWIFVDGGDVV